MSAEVQFLAKDQDHHLYQAGVDKPERIKSIAESYGFCLVKNVLSLSELETLEAAMAEITRSGLKFPDLMSLAPTRKILLNEKVLAVAHALLGPELFYYGESNLQYEDQVGPLTLQPYNVLHCDARGTTTNLSAQWAGTGNQIYRGYRFAFYCRDYADFSGGLKVAVASHLRPEAELIESNTKAGLAKLPLGKYLIGRHELTLSTPAFELFNIPSKPGDLVIFNLRTYHAAGFQRLADRKPMALLPAMEEFIKQQAPELFLPNPGPRNAIFFDYCDENADIDLYIKWRALNRTGSSADRLNYDDNGIISEALSRNVKFRFDKIIVSLALRLAAYIEQHGIGIADGPLPSEMPGELRGDVRRLMSLCKQHREFSPYHALFDKQAFGSFTSHENSLGALNPVLKGLNHKTVQK